MASSGFTSAVPPFSRPTNAPANMKPKDHTLMKVLAALLSSQQCALETRIKTRKRGTAESRKTASLTRLQGLCYKLSASPTAVHIQQAKYCWHIASHWCLSATTAGSEEPRYVTVCFGREETWLIEQVCPPDIFNRPLADSRLQCHFQASDDPLPVYTHPQQILYYNHPTSMHRPKHQFHDCSRERISDNPMLTIITATKNPGEHFEETAASVLSQSLRNLRWLIIDDHTEDVASLARLLQAGKRDPRVLVLRSNATGGLVSARNQGLQAVAERADIRAPFIALLDDDDILELTALEKAVWMLLSNVNWSIAGYHFVKFGHQNTTETRGLHSGHSNYFRENYIANSAVIRFADIGDCRYDTSFATGGEDWDFWLCLAEKGHWGGTLPELAYWYRVNDPNFRKTRWGNTFFDRQGHDALIEHIKHKHDALHDHLANFAAGHILPSQPLEPVSWHNRFENTMVMTGSRSSLLFVLPWMAMGGADIGALRMLEVLTDEGFRVTVVCTLYDPPTSIVLQPLFMQWTHDIHILPSFLRASDMAPYIAYLARSRSISTVLFSNSMLLYDLLPVLRERLPASTAIVDYLHNESEDWKSGGYPRYSVLYQRYIDRTIASSEYLKDWLVHRGHQEARIGVVKLGVDLEETRRSNNRSSAQSELRKELYNITYPATVILTVARIDTQKRPLLIPEIISQLLSNYGFTSCGKPSDSFPEKSLFMVMVGTGPLNSQLEKEIARLGLQNCIFLAGIQGDTTPYYLSADMFLLPSSHEGISVAVSEAMAAGLPVVATHAGALPEQLGRADDPLRAGVLVTASVPEDGLPVAKDYAIALSSLLNNTEQIQRLAANGIERTREMDWRKSLKALVPELEVAHRARERPRSRKELEQLPHPSAELATQTQLHEFFKAFDLKRTQQRLADW